MEGAPHTDVIVAALLAAVVVLLIAAHVVRIPYPVLLVIGGLALGFIPGMPRVQLEPDLVLLIILPPLLYAAAFFSSLRDLRANLRQISFLSIGLVAMTMLAVATVAHVAVGLSWPAAFVLGAIVSPTDPVAATSIAGRLHVPRRIVSVVEGESLINDATALVAYKFAVAAVLTGSFSLPEAVLQFFLSAGGGVAIGLAVGWLVAEVRRRIEDAPTEIAISLVTAYLAYLPAEALGLSGVLAAVTVGIFLGWRAPQLVTPTTRLQAFAVWEILIFVLNSALFILIGLQLPVVLDELSREPVGRLITYAALVSAVVMATRIAWVLPATYLSRLLWRRIQARDALPPWREPTVVAWAGMRGAVSLAAALALPLSTDAGAPFPDRDLIVFLAFSVILATLLIQGLSLPALISRLNLEDDAAAEHEEVRARLHAAQAALARIDELVEEEWVREDTAERMRGIYQYRLRRFGARFDDGDDGDYEERSAAYQRLRREVLEAERRAVVALRNEGRIDDEVMHRVERDLDLEHSRLES